MQIWEQLLDIRWPEAACDQSGECCRGAAQYQPWKNIIRQAAQADPTAKAFLSQYQPYPTRLIAEMEAPHAVEASLKVIGERNQNPDDVIFYRCIYLKGKNQCQIYEDRPALCRDFPESPFSAIPKCCGYASVQKTCTQKAAQLKAELEHLKTLKAKLNSAFTDKTP